MHLGVLNCRPHPLAFPFPYIFLSKLLGTVNRSRYIITTTPAELQGSQAKSAMAAQGLTLLIRKLAPI